MPVVFPVIQSNIEGEYFMEFEEYLRSGQLKEALASVQAQVRSNPADAKLRVLLFQLLSVLGDWDRAMNQLNVSAEMDGTNLLMAQVCRTALNCEALRAQIFAGERTPMVFGEPAEWVGLLVQANQVIGRGQYASSQPLREQAFEAAPASGGTIDGNRFEWIADADTRFGPVLEAIIEGRYYWVPFCNIRQISIEEPNDLRDVVWIPAQFVWANGGEMFGLIPSRYPGSEKIEDNDIRLARKTEWTEYDAGVYLGLGQRMFATDEGEYSLLETRQICFDADESEESAKEEA